MRMKRRSLPPDVAEAARAGVPERLLRDMSAGDVFEYLRRPVGRRAVLKGAGAAVLAGPALWIKPGRASEPPRGVHITYGDDPRTTMNVSWFTGGPVANPVLEIGDTPAYGTVIPAASTTYSPPPSIPQPISIQHHASIAGLQPDTTYYYRVRHDGAASAVFKFKTAPAEIVPFRFTSFGDHGSDPGTATSRVSWGTAFSPRAVRAVEALDPAFHVHNGDLSYSCGGPQLAWDVWFDQIQSRAARMPWMASLGNHEMELGFGPRGYDPFRSRFRLPSNGVDTAALRSSTFSSFRYSNTLVMLLDGNEAASEYGYHFNRGYLAGAQDAWIESTLRAARADDSIDWIVVSFHNCMFCTDVVHGSDGGCRTRWQALFDAYRVDVVLNGHNHCYERTYPILGGDHTVLLPDQPIDPAAMGVTYVTAGGGGQLAAPRSVSTHPVSVLHNEAGEREIEQSLWRASRIDGYTVAVVDVDPGTPGGITTLTLTAREFMTDLMAPVDRIVLTRPAKAAAAGQEAVRAAAK